MRNVEHTPPAVYFKPAGVPMRELEEECLSLDEVEALRLADMEGRYQEEAAQRMKISRPTFSRLVESARRKTARALVTGRALRVEGGPVHLTGPGRGRGRGRHGRGGRGSGWMELPGNKRKDM